MNIIPEAYNNEGMVPSEFTAFYNMKVSSSTQEPLSFQYLNKRPNLLFINTFELFYFDCDTKKADHIRNSFIFYPF